MENLSSNSDIEKKHLETRNEEIGPHGKTDALHNNGFEEELAPRVTLKTWFVVLVSPSFRTLTF
jgi:hypothetical protein